MKREVLTTVTFKENCEYESSTNTRKIAVPKQTVEVSISSIVNHTNPARDKTPQYNDKLQFIASVYQNYIGDDNQQHRTSITIGRIEFYYLPDGAKTPILLNSRIDTNTNSCMLNSAGNTSIIYRPNKRGQIFAKYIDDNDFYETAISPYVEVNMQPIKVDIKIDAPPVLVDVHDEVELTAHVTKKGTNEPIQYGVVTFLHYQSTDDINQGTNERVIGNPVMVEEDGTAKIKYVPVQTDDDNEPYIINPPYKENIRAIYNYSNELYGEQWRYYQESWSNWTQIAVCGRDSITIGLDSNHIDSVTGEHQYEEGENINLYGIITNKDGNPFEIKNVPNENYNANLTFHIRGTHAHPKKNPADLSSAEEDFFYVEYKKDINATYISQQDFYFHTTINNLLPGSYTITASCKEQEDVYGKMYDAIDESNVLYVEVNYVRNLPKITLSSSKTLLHIEEPINNFTVTVPNLSNTQKNILNGKTCHFYTPTNERPYTGKMKYNNNSLTATLEDGISFNQVGLYNVNMFIPIGVYTNSTESSNYHGSNVDFYIGENESNPLLIQVTNEPIIKLNIDVQKRNAPGMVEYAIRGEYISEPITVDVFLLPHGGGNISMINQITLTPSMSSTVEVRDFINDIEAGEYTIEVSTPNDDVISKTFSIEINNLQSAINENSKKILGTPQNTVSALLYSKSDLSGIDTNKIKAYIQSANTDFDITKAKQATIQSTKLMKDGSLNVIVKTGLYKEGTWWLMLGYDGGSGFTKINCTPQKFETFLYTPKVKLINYQGSFRVQVYYDDDTHYINNNALLIETVFVHHQTQVARGVIVTDENGFGSFQDSRCQTADWWSAWSHIVFIFKPYDANDISIMKTQPAYNALDNKYDYVFDSNNLISNNQPSYSIKNQIIGNEEQALYTGYKECEIRVTRPLE